MQVLIMAAGESKRLRPLTDKKPKTLLPLGEKEILHHILEMCKKNNLKKFHLVTGHGDTEVKNFIDKYQEENPELEFNIIYNDEYNTKGNIYSMYKAREIFNEDFILINSDTIFHCEILQYLIDHDEKNVMVLDDHKKLSNEEMKICLHEKGHIEKIHKSLDPKTSHGEYIGVMRMDSDFKDQLIKSLEAVLEKDDSLYYEDALQHFMDSGIPFYTVSTCGLPCMEIDTHEDLDEAKEMIKKICL